MSATVVVDDGIKRMDEKEEAESSPGLTSSEEEEEDSSATTDDDEEEEKKKKKKKKQKSKKKKRLVVVMPKRKKNGNVAAAAAIVPSQPLPPAAAPVVATTAVAPLLPPPAVADAPLSSSSRRDRSPSPLPPRRRSPSRRRSPTPPPRRGRSPIRSRRRSRSPQRRPLNRIVSDADVIIGVERGNAKRQFVYARIGVLEQLTGMSLGRFRDISNTGSVRVYADSQLAIHLRRAYRDSSYPNSDFMRNVASMGSWEAYDREFNALQDFGSQAVFKASITTAHRETYFESIAAASQPLSAAAAAPAGVVVSEQ